MLRVRHGVAHDVLEEHLEDAARLLVDEARDALDTATTRQAADRGLLRNKGAGWDKKGGKGRGGGRAVARGRGSACGVDPSGYTSARGIQLPPRPQRRRTVMPWMLSRKTLRWRLAPPLPRPLPPLPRPDIFCCWDCARCLHARVACVKFGKRAPAWRAAPRQSRSWNPCFGP